MSVFGTGSHFKLKEQLEKRLKGRQEQGRQLLFDRQEGDIEGL